VLPLRYAVVAALVSALVPTGALPVHHLHPATPARPTIVHAHVDYGAAADAHSPPTVEDEHDVSVPLSQVMAGGQARRVVAQPGVLPHPARSRGTSDTIPTAATFRSSRSARLIPHFD